MKKLKYILNIIVIVLFSRPTAWKYEIEKLKKQLTYGTFREFPKKSNDDLNESKNNND